jgi:hypothetical protein
MDLHTSTSLPGVYAVEHEKLAADAEGKALSLPSANATEKLLRHRNNWRQMVRWSLICNRVQRSREDIANCNRRQTPHWKTRHATCAPIARAWKGVPPFNENRPPEVSGVPGGHSLLVGQGSRLPPILGRSFRL